MVEYGVQDDGTFRRKPVDVIIEDLEQTFRDNLGSDVSLRQNSAKKQLLDATAIEIGRQWQAAEAAYYASFYQDSFGEQLDKQLALAGFSRIPARSATGEVELSRADPAPKDITIDAGTIVTTTRTETRPPIPFETTEDVVIIRDGTTVTAPIEALKPWQTDLNEKWLGQETNVNAATITRFEEPVSGVDGVTNPNPTGDESLGYVEGRDREADAAFKLRYENSLAEGGVSTVPAIESTVFNWSEDIASVRVDEVRNQADGYGPEVTALAPGVPADTIAQAILESRAGGLESFGNKTGTATMTDGTQKTESFNRATRQTIVADITLTTSATYPTDGQTRIENGIIRYIGGVAHDGIEYPGLEIGADVVQDQVKRRVMEIRGVVEADVLIAIDGNVLADTNVAIGDLEAAMTGINDITVA